MKTRYFLGLAFLASALAFSAGCSDDASDDPQDNTGGNAGEGGSGGSGGTGGDGGSGGGDGGSGGTGGDGGSGGGEPGDPFESATELQVNPNQATEATLADAQTPDYYKFTGKAGDRIVIGTAAQDLDPNSDGDDNTIIDTVITLYDANKNVIARNDDTFPRYGRDAALHTILPKDGVYYFTVEDCNSAFGPDSCAPADGLEVFDYQVWVATFDKLTANDVRATSANNDIDNAVAVDYGTKTSQGYYPFTLFSGVFESEGETHVFSFTPPADTPVDESGRLRAEFFVYVNGKELGNGSDANVKIRVTNSAGDVVYASANQANHGTIHDWTNQPLNVSVPVNASDTYHLFVENADGSGTDNKSFYIISHFIGSYWWGVVEAEGADASGANDDFANAETATRPQGAPDGYYFIDGNLFEGTDVDWFRVEVPDGATAAAISCNVQRVGSGLRGFKAELFSIVDDEPGEVVLQGTDAADADFFVQGSVSGGDYFLKLSAASLADGVAGDHYLCYVAVQ